jgi:hypothetical protein
MELNSITTALTIDNSYTSANSTGYVHILGVTSPLNIVSAVMFAIGFDLTVMTCVQMGSQIIMSM